MKRLLRFNQKLCLLTASMVLLALSVRSQMTDGLVGNYSFNGGNANDEALANHGTAVGATLTTGHEGNANTAYSFNGTGYIHCTASNVVNNLKTAYSLSAWFKRSAYAGDLQAIVAKWSGSESFDHFLLGTQNDRIVLATAGPGKNGTSTTATFALNVWNHVVLTWETTGVHKVYLNGVQIFTMDLTTYVAAPQLSNVLIGAQSPTVRRFIGDIDDVRIYNRDLQIDEVSVLYGLNMDKQNQTITFDAISGEIVEGDDSFELSAATTSGLPITYTSTNAAAISISGTTATVAGGGVTYLSAVQGGDATYNGEAVTRKLIVKKTQSITFGTLPDKTVLAPNFALAATSNSALSVSYTSSNTNVAIISGATVDVVGTGTTTITATQVGNDFFVAATPVEQVLTVNKENQTITFNALSDREQSEGTFTLSATASSTLPVNFTSSDDEIASVSGNVVTLHKPGAVTITASQTGNGTYNAATPVDRMFTVSIGNGLVARYNFTGDANDLAKGNNGTVSNAALSTDRFGTSNAAYTFNGTNAVINCGNTSIINNLTKAYTLSAWFKRTAATTDLEVIVSKWGGLVASDHFLLGTQNNKFVFATAGPGKGGITSTASYPLDTWNHVVLTYESTGVHKLYLNNQLVGTNTLAAYAISISSPVNLTIGGQAGGTRFFTGAVDDVSIFNGALTPEQITLLFNENPARENQIVTFNSIEEKKFGGVAFSLEATASSSLPISFSSSDTNVISINGATATITGVGTAIITATQEGDGTYNGNFASQVVRVTKNDQSLDLSSYAAVYLIDGSFTLPSTTDQGLSVTYQSSNPSVLNVSGSTVTLGQFGEVTLTATQAGNDFYNPLSIQQVVNVQRSNQTIEFEPFDVVQYGINPIELPETSAEGLTLTYASNNTDVAIVEGNLLTVRGVGTVVITASQEGNFYYNPATSIEQELTIEKGDQEIFIDEFGIYQYGDDDIQLAATTIAGLTISYSSNNADVAMIEGSTIVIVGVGSTTITANQAGNDFYNAASTIERVLTVEKADQEIVLEPFESATYGDDAISLSAMTSAQLTIEYSSSNTAVATITGSTINIVAPGTAIITASHPGNNFYNAVSVEKELIVSKADQEIVFNPFNTVTWGDSDLSLEENTSIGLPVTYFSSNTSVATIVGNVIEIVAPGTTVITASHAGNVFYNAVSVEQTLVIDKASQQIQFEEFGTVTYGDDDITLEGFSSADLSITYESSNATVATISGSTVILGIPGTTVITATQIGNDYYLPVTAQRTLNYFKATQEIIFGDVTTKTMGDGSFVLVATSTSDLPVSFSASNGKVSINNNQVTLVSAGSVTIAASQSGDSNYQSASEVSRTFCINPAKPAITSNFTDTSAPILLSSESAGNQWYRNGVIIAGATTTSYTALEQGTYTVQSTIDGCMGALSEGFILVVTGLEAGDRKDQVVIYPNPALDFVTLELPETGEKRVMIYQADGKVVYTNRTQDSSLAVDVRSFATGISHVVVTTGSIVHSGRIIKKL